MHKEFRGRLMELSDINLQRRLWLNINNTTGLISSYSELFNTLLNDFNFIYEIGNVEDKNLKQKLLKLKIMLEEYKEPYHYEKNYDDSIILDDLKWQEIVDFAKIIIKDANFNDGRKWKS